jgi:hypothetical protein
MLNAVNNYNTLGKLGPHYERPEYRPPSREAEDQPSSARAGDRRTLSHTKKGAEKKPPAPAPAPIPARLNMASARNLVAALAAQITVLPPQSTDREPHTWLRSYLMVPIYA